ncbi:MAG: thioredoxin family protein [Pricia sp.]
MNFLERVIDFQNRAERDFEKRKNVRNGLKYLTALIIFFASTLFSAFTMPFRYLSRKFSKSSSSTILVGNNKNMDTILEKERLVLIDFWADWCGPCIMMNPAIEEFAENTDQVRVVKINADLNMKILKRYKVKGLPHFLLFEQGEEMRRYAGSMTVKDLHKFCFGE